MAKSKQSPNKLKFLKVDKNLAKNQNQLTANTKYTKCAIINSQIQEQYDFFVFKSKLLWFQVTTRVNDRDTKTAKFNWVVKRYENDFYIIR